MLSSVPPTGICILLRYRQGSFGPIQGNTKEGSHFAIRSITAFTDSVFNRNCSV